MRRPKLSIVTPTYNRAEMLNRYLQSAQCVTVDCEIVIVDNASPDNTEMIVKQWAQRDPRIRYLRNDHNIGVLGNYNKAFAEARGENICCLSDDDAILSGNFEQKLALLEANPDIGLVYSLWHRMDEQGRPLGVCLWPGLVTTSYIASRSEFLDLLPACYMHLQSVVFRRQLWDEFGGFDLNPEMFAGTDWDMLLRYCRHARTAFLAEPLVCVGVHSQSQTESVCRKNAQFARGRIAIWRKWLVEDDDPPLLDESRWQRMKEAFLPDLQYELGSDTDQIAFYIQELERLKQESFQKIAQCFAIRMQAGVQEALAPNPIENRKSKIENPTPLVWNAPLRDPSGYADEARHFLFALNAAGMQVTAREMRWNDRIAALTPARAQTLQQLLDRPMPRNAVHVSHILAPHFQTAFGALANVGRTMFETDRLPEGWADACNRMDAVWVPGEFNRETFANAGVRQEKLRVVPGAIDLAPYDPDCAPLQIQGAKGFNFLSVFDWTLRKGWDVLIRAFVEEFRAEEDVALLFKTHSSLGYSLEQIVQKVTSYLTETLGRDLNRIPDIIFQDTNIPDAMMPHLYRAADCYVMPTRGEGWGRPLMEAMAMGLPTIGTGWSGQTAFMNSANSLLLDYEVVEVPEVAWRETPTYRGHRWAEPSVTHLRQLMRRVFEDRAGGRELGLRARADIETHFSYAPVACTIREEVERLGCASAIAA